MSVQLKLASAATGATLVTDLTFGGLNLLMASSIMVGLFAGAVLRSGDRIDANASRADIRRDLRVSATALLANFIISAIVVSLGTLALPVVPPLAAAGTGLFFGYMGRTSIQWFRANVLRMKDDAPPVKMTEPVREPDHAMERSLPKLDGKGPSDD